MKKILSLILALTLVMSLSVTAFAVDNQEEMRDVKATYNLAPGANAPVINVKVDWGNMRFVYYDNTVKKWNPATHDYDRIEVEDKSWRIDDNQDKVTVTNHSNTDVKVTFSFDSTVRGITGKFTQIVAGVDEPVEVNHVILANGDGLSHANADSKTVKLTLVGALAPLEQQVTAGTAKVTFEAYNQNN